MQWYVGMTVRFVSAAECGAEAGVMIRRILLDVLGRANGLLASRPAWSPTLVTPSSAAQSIPSCVAIGPGWSARVDQVTRELPF